MKVGMKSLDVFNIYTLKTVHYLCLKYYMCMLILIARNLPPLSAGRLHNLYIYLACVTQLQR